MGGKVIWFGLQADPSRAEKGRWRPPRVRRARLWDRSLVKKKSETASKAILIASMRGWQVRER
jgi:hypothetical protein